jgi:hypothetical protein
MSALRIEDVRFSSSAIDEFFSDLKPVPRVASGKVRISGLHQLAGFEAVSDDKLVRVSKKDFWRLGQDAEGYFIERLVNDDEGPIRED